MTRLVLLALCACIPDNGPLMRPGEDCLFCHSSTGGATPWIAAGTVFRQADGGQGFEGARVRLTDANGFSVASFSEPRTIVMISNMAPNDSSRNRPVTIGLLQFWTAR